MTYKHADNILQWTGAVFIIAGHSFNALGTQWYPWNILAFVLGTLAFGIWCVRVGNRPQLLVNAVAMVIGISGLFKALG